MKKSSKPKKAQMKKSAKQMFRLIEDVLLEADLHNNSASWLILGTGAVESQYRYVEQIQGPARSYWQVEPRTSYDNVHNFLMYRPELFKRIGNACSVSNNSIEHLHLDGHERLLRYNIAFAILMARLKFWRDPNPIPKTFDKMGDYWLGVYNTQGGKGTKDKWRKHWKNVVGFDVKDHTLRSAYKEYED